MVGGSLLVLQLLPPLKLVIFSYEFVITSPRGYYCLEEGNMCCQENACSVLVFSSSNEGKFSGDK
jgi:hypothetical protein